MINKKRRMRRVPCVAELYFDAREIRADGVRGSGSCGRTKRSWHPGHLILVVVVVAHRVLLTAVKNGGAGKCRGGRNWWRAMAQPCEERKIGASAPILPNLEGRPRSAIGYGVLERSSSTRVDG